MLSFNLRSCTSDFKNKRYDTFVGNGFSEGKHQIDFVLISNDLRKNIMNAKRTQNGIVDSDHAAIKISSRFVLKKSKRKFAEKKKTEVRLDWKKLKCPTTANLFSHNVDKNMENNNDNIISSSSAERLASAILDAASNTCIAQERIRQDWFSRDKNNLMDKIKRRNNAFEEWSKIPNGITKSMLSITRANLRKAIVLAKNKWIEFQLESITEEKFKKDPRLGWQTINKINDGITGHHIKTTAMKFKNKEGVISQTDKENVEAITQHFNEI